LLANLPPPPLPPEKVNNASLIPALSLLPRVASSDIAAPSRVAAQLSTLMLQVKKFAKTILLVSLFAYFQIWFNN
jgi:hypothetical protein